MLLKLPTVKLVISTLTLKADKANANLINGEVTKLLRNCKKKIITHQNIKEEHLDKYGLLINNIDTRLLVKSLLLGAQAIWHAKDSSIKADSENILNLIEYDSSMPICQFLEHQIRDWLYFIFFYYTKCWNTK